MHLSVFASELCYMWLEISKTNSLISPTFTASRHMLPVVNDLLVITNCTREKAYQMESNNVSAFPCNYQIS